MLTMFTAQTSQIDSPEEAVADIMKKIRSQLQSGLKKNAIGIVACHTDYVIAGVIPLLHKELPFDIVGCTTFGCAVNAGGSTESLTLTVLTSDTVEFASAVSEPLTEQNYEAALADVYQRTRSRLGGEPESAFILGPIMTEIIGDQMNKKFPQELKNIPIFGTLSNDVSVTYGNTFVFYNEEIHRSQFVLTLIRGGFKPRFYTAAFTAGDVRRQTYTVTESTGWYISKINDMPLPDFLAQVGIQSQYMTCITVLPVLVDYADGTKSAAYSLYGLTEKGAYCGTEVPVGTLISFDVFNYDSVVKSCDEALSAALEDIAKNGANGMIAIPCFTRALVMSPKVEDEIGLSLSYVQDKVPFSLFYSGGEFCPVYDDSGNFVNRFHNLTYTIMVF